MELLLLALLSLSGPIDFQVRAGTRATTVSIRLARDGAALFSGTAQRNSAPGLFSADPAVVDGAARAALSRLVPQVYIAGELAPVQYSALAPSFPGLWQIGALIPGSVAVGQAPVFAALGRAASNAVTAQVGK